MKPHISILILCVLAMTLSCYGQENRTPYERIIKNYFSGWVKKDWSIVSSQLAAGFTFTSATPDDHIPVDKFR